MPPTPTTPPTNSRPRLMKATLALSGLSCASCVKSIEQVLEKLPTTSSISVNLLMSNAVLTYDSTQLSITQISDAITGAGFEVENVNIAEITPSTPEKKKSVSKKSKNTTKSTSNSQPKSRLMKATLSLSGLSCASCVKSIEQVLEKLPTASSISVNLLMSNAVLTYDPSQLSITQISDAITGAGFEVDNTSVAEITSTSNRRASILTENTSGQLKRVSCHSVLSENENGELKMVIIEEENNASKSEGNSLSTVKLEVGGMTCASCVNNIQESIQDIEGVVDVSVNLLTHTATIHYNSSLVGPRDLIQHIEKIGYSASLLKQLVNSNSIRDRAQKEEALLKRRFLISILFAIPTFIIAMIFMTMIPESNHIRMFFMNQIIPGLEVGTLVMFCLSTPVQFYLGYPFYVKAWRSLRYARVANMDTLVSIGTTVAYLGSIANVLLPIIQHSDQAGQQFFETSIFLITFIWLGRWMEAKAKGKTYETITKLMELQPDTATLAKFESDGEWEKVVEEREIDLALVQVGDILKVNAGARVPCDGKIYRGTTTLDESMITGESIPVAKGKDDDVISATVNQSSTIYIMATRVGAETTLSRIISLVQEAQSSKKAPVEALADKIAQIFVPMVISLAILDFILWLSIGASGHIPSDWIPQGQNYPIFSLFFGISVMVIACPCAMGLASPTAIMVGTGMAARFGILVKGGGDAIEKAHRVNVIAFDKTGTLTFGKPKVVKAKALYQPSQQRGKNIHLLWQIIGTVESSSDHPLAKAVTQYIDGKIFNLNSNSLTEKPQLPNNNDNSTGTVYLDEVREVAGKGLEAKVIVKSLPPEFIPGITTSHSATLKVYIGNEKWMRENNCTFPSYTSVEESKALLKKWKSSGSSIVLVGLATESSEKGLILAQFGVADTPRSDAAATVWALHSLGIEVWMITGDNPVTARAIAAKVGIENVLAEVTPEQKAKKIKWLQRRSVYSPSTSIVLSMFRKIGILMNGKGGTDSNHRPAVVAMIGDGINDSPALVQSDLPISIANATDVAIESASVILTRSTLWSLVTLISLSHAIIKKIKMNFLWAYIYNTLAIPIAAGALFPLFKFALRPEIAGLAMAASSVSVVMSSLLLKRFKEPKIGEI